MPLRLDNAAALPTCPQQPQTAPEKEQTQSRDSRLTMRLGRCQRTNQPERLAPGRDQIGEVDDIVSESPGDFKSVHPGDIIGIRSPCHITRAKTEAAPSVRRLMQALAEFLDHFPQIVRVFLNYPPRLFQARPFGLRHFLDRAGLFWRLHVPDNWRQPNGTIELDQRAVDLSRDADRMSLVGHFRPSQPVLPANRCPLGPDSEREKRKVGVGVSRAPQCGQVSSHMQDHSSAHRPLQRSHLLRLRTSGDGEARWERRRQLPRETAGRPIYLSKSRHALAVSRQELPEPCIGMAPRKRRGSRESRAPGAPAARVQQRCTR
jgi:hypothetical protein